MEHLEKVLRKLSGKERALVEKALNKLKSGVDSVRMKKLRGEDCLRIRVGTYRILVHFENGAVVVDDIRKRNEGTYKNLPY